MKKYAIITKLEESLEDYKFLSYEAALKILSRKGVSSALDKMFDGINEVSLYELEQLSNNFMLVNLLCLYAKKNNITIIKGEPKVDIYDELLEDENEIDSLIEYKKSILGFDPLDEYEIENALLSGSEIDVENITRTYLPEIFELMLSRTEDKHFFKEMVDAGNEVLIKCIKTYDKKKHVSFDDYFKYMLNYVILNNVDKYYDRLDSPETKVIVVKDMSDAIVERVEMRKIINEMLDNSFLSNTERAIIEIRYGMFDGNLYDKKDTATLLGISEVTVDTIEEEALGKMRLLHAARLAREYKTK